MAELAFTGTQQGMTDVQSAAVCALMSCSEHDAVHHGMCIGADVQFEEHVLAIRAGNELPVVHGWPGLDRRGGSPKRGRCSPDVEHFPMPYIERNHAMVDRAVTLLAAPKGYSEELYSGTWATIRYAAKRGVATVIVYPDGSLEDRP